MDTRIKKMGYYLSVCNITKTPIDGFHKDGDEKYYQPWLYCFTLLARHLLDHRKDYALARVSAIWLPLQWRHNGLDGVSNHQPHHCLLSRLFGRRSKKSSKLRVTGLCAGNSPGTGECGEFAGAFASHKIPLLFAFHFQLLQKLWGQQPLFMFQHP